MTNGEKGFKLTEEWLKGDGLTEWQDAEEKYNEQLRGRR